MPRRAGTRRPAPFRSSRTACHALCALAAGFVHSKHAFALDAPPPPERVRLVYAPGADCPTPEALERELDARLGSGWQARPDELARSIAVSEAVAGEEHVIRIEYPGGGEHPGVREVAAHSCNEAAAMTAVIVAVAIDALAHEHDASQVVAMPALPAVTKPPVPSSTVRAHGTVEVEPTKFVHEAGLRAGVTTGFGTRVAWGAGVEWGLVGPNGFAVRAAFEARLTGSVPAADAEARFSAFTARADACMVALRLSDAFSVPLCLGLEAGVLRAEGVVSPPAVTAAKPSVAPWFAGLLTPRLRLATARAYAELVPELRLPFVGHTFVFDSPERRAFSIPSFAFGVSLAAGMRFQ